VRLILRRQIAGSDGNLLKEIVVTPLLTTPSLNGAFRIGSLFSPIWLRRLGQRIPARPLFAALLCGIALVASVNLAQASDYQGCAIDRPCFNGYRQAGNKVIFDFTGVTGWDFYNLRYAAAGGGEKQVENRSGHFTFNNIKPRRIYTLKVQGCRSRFLAPSVCSPWVSQSVTTR
jgi:hypothetical protein